MYIICVIRTEDATQVWKQPIQIQHAALTTERRKRKRKDQKQEGRGHRARKEQAKKGGHKEE